MHLPIVWLTVTDRKSSSEWEWLAQKHKTKGIRRRWRRLYFGLNRASAGILSADRAYDNGGDRTA